MESMVLLWAIRGTASLPLRAGVLLIWNWGIVHCLVMAIAATYEKGSPSQQATDGHWLGLQGQGDTWVYPLN